MLEGQEEYTRKQDDRSREREKNLRTDTEGRSKEKQRASERYSLHGRLRGRTDSSSHSPQLHSRLRATLRSRGQAQSLHRPTDSRGNLWGRSQQPRLAGTAGRPSDDVPILSLRIRLLIVRIKQRLERRVVERRPLEHLLALVRGRRRRCRRRGCGCWRNGWGDVVGSERGDRRRLDVLEAVLLPQRQARLPRACRHRRFVIFVGRVVFQRLGQSRVVEALPEERDRSGLDRSQSVSAWLLGSRGGVGVRDERGGEREVRGQMSDGVRALRLGWGGWQSGSERRVERGGGIDW